MNAMSQLLGRKRVLRLRHRTYEVLEQALPGDQVARWVHVGLMAWIVASVAAVVLESVPSYREAFELEFLAVEVASITVFTAEYLLRLWASADYPPYRHLGGLRARLRFALTGGAIVDLLAIVPFYLSLVMETDFRVFIVFRLVRFLKLARYSPGMRSLYEAVFEERRALAACLIILSGLVLASASIMHLVERTAQPDKFGTIPDAMWWAVITLATVGYGDVVPITVLGKIVASITALMGLIMIALPVGIVATAFAEVIHRRDFVVTWGMIARVPLFADLGAEEVSQILQLLRSQAAESGEIIVRKGDVGHSMYFIASGQVEIELPHGKHALLGDGQFFGEMAVLRSTRRSATIRALTRTQLLVLDASDLRLLMASRPDIATRIREVAAARAEEQRIEASHAKAAQESENGRSPVEDASPEGPGSPSQGQPGKDAPDPSAGPAALEMPEGELPPLGDEGEGPDDEPPSRQGRRAGRTLPRKRR